MLVVSRKQNQSIVFPSLGISVEILRVSGKTVSVGVQAPDDVRILRGEIAANAEQELAPTPGERALTEKKHHDFKNRLNQVSLAISLAQKQLANGAADDAAKSLANALDTLQQWEQEDARRRNVPPGVSFEPGAMVPGKPRKKALLVEDDPNERRLLASYLHASGYDVETAEDGHVALERLAKQKPDAVVMDMEMPRLHGRDCVRQIRSDRQFDDLKLFVVSGMDRERMQVPLGDRGVQRWFSKPLQPEELVFELANSLN